MSLLDTFTGGKSNEASDAYKRAEKYFQDVQTPTVAQLTLPQLQQYVEAGVMTPAQAQAYLQQSNAYNTENVNQAGTDAQISAINQLQEVANAGDMGTPQEQAAMDAAEQNMNRSVGGQRGAIEQSMAAKGTPAALIQAALENQTVGQDAQQAHMDAVNAQAAAYQNAYLALDRMGQLGSGLQGQQNAQANTVAGAQNAMQQFNAQNQQQNAQANANRTQEANAMNASNRQQVSNNNVGNANARTQYNANLPETVFNNQMEKAGGMAGAATNYGNLQQNQGKQNAAITSGVINTATSFIPKPTSATPGSMPTGQEEGPQYPGQGHGYAHGGVIDGGICMEEGGMVPGQASVPGDSLMNDNMPIQASPGEAVIPRSSVAQHPDLVNSLISGQDTEIVDPQDVATLLKAMKALRMGAV